MRALVVEDDFVSRKVLTAFLSPHAEIDIAVDGEEAIAAYSLALRDGEPYQLICLDVMMPKLDGIAVLKHVREVEREMRLSGDATAKILMTTAISDRDNVLRILKAGCDGYLVKPYERDRLTAELERLGLVHG